ncbi:MAG: glutamate-5-semialdehyde dehydrogenase [Pedobacter sp.]|nr:MAG: glutamate-5-semialdehyde dehydrogenase [Pedobacter sp.]
MYLSQETIDKILLQLAADLIEQTDFLIQQNKLDLNRMDQHDPKYDRLRLDAERIAAIAADLINVSKFPHPLGEVLTEKTLPNGLQLSKVRVPIGVIGVIYESRPNVTVDVFALCFKTGNVVLLKGSADAEYSNLALIKIIEEVLISNGVNKEVATLLPAERAATAALLQATGFVDVIIPRGSQQLISYVREHSKIPVIETGAGIVHTYFDKSADLVKGQHIICNAKTRRVSVCNALDCVLLHKDRIAELPNLFSPLAAEDVAIYADESSYQALDGSYPESLLFKAEPSHYGTEFLSLKLAVKVVSGIEEALDHIAQYSSKHSEAIIAEDGNAINLFLRAVDAAAVYANASTAFTDGGQFGLGAEIGISTQKLHARGPMGLEELTSYKWLIRGSGQVR